MSQPLPLTRQEMLDRGWDSVDVVFVTGDAYVDHPSFAAALRVGILAQPDWHSAELGVLCLRRKYGLDDQSLHRNEPGLFFEQ